MNSFRFLIPLFLCVVSLGRQDSQAQTLVEFETNLGNIEIELFDSERPISVENFLGYVNRGDYDGTIFHRTQSIANAQGIDIVQGGGFTTTGASITTLGPIVNEAATDQFPLNTAGTIAYARTTALDSATSQFFFNASDSPALDTQIFAVFGRVNSGIDVVNQILNLDTIGATAGLNTFDDLPVLDVANGAAASNLVILQSASVIATSVPEPNGVVLMVLAGTLGLVRRRRA